MIPRHPWPEHGAVQALSLTKSFPVKTDVHMGVTGIVREAC